MKNQKYSLKALQMAYIGVTKQETGKECALCWEHKCDCEYDHTKDSFITHIDLPAY